MQTLELKSNQDNIISIKERINIMNIEDKIVYTNIPFALGILHRQGLERLEDLSVTTPFNDAVKKEYDELRHGLHYINNQLEHYNFLLEKGYEKRS